MREAKSRARPNVDVLAEKRMGTGTSR
jgi:hypothetical protein